MRMIPRHSIPVEDAVYHALDVEGAAGCIYQDPKAIRQVVESYKGNFAKNGNRPLHPAIQALQDIIEMDATIFRLAHQMWKEPSRNYRNHAEGSQLDDYKQMCGILNEIIRNPPPYSDEELICAFPIYTVFDWAAGTPSGLELFQNLTFSKAIGAVLNAWSEYLTSPDSLVAFGDGPNGGWSSPKVTAKLHMELFSLPKPDAFAWGFTSWNDWFTRQFRPGIRPIAHPDDNNIICSPCESYPFALQTNVKMRSEFWIKKQPYALSFLLNDEDWANYFVGGIVYQAYLSTYEYHRWHSPISGRIKEWYLIPGCYYAECASLDRCSPNSSQSFVTHTNTRVLIYIESDNDILGTVCFVGVGLGEVSSCNLSVVKDQRVAKGQELGYFQFGGSTFCLVFRKGAIKMWNAHAVPKTSAEPVKVNSYLACAADSPSNT